MVQCHSRSPNVDSVEFIRRLAVGNVGTGADCLDLNFPSLFSAGPLSENYQEWTEDEEQQSSHLIDVLVARGVLTAQTGVAAAKKSHVRSSSWNM